MSWVVAENTPTATVVWMAAELIGKAQNHEQLQRICDYLVNKHWFQTAADLRSARRETTEWQALEVPGRLKLAIQQVLDQTTPHQEPFSTFGYEDYYAAVRPSISSEGEAATQSWSDATAAYDQAQTAAADFYAGSYTYPVSDTTTGTTAERYSYDQSGYATNPPTYEESYGADHETYCNSSATSGYNESGAAATTLLSLQSSSEQVLLDDSDVVEAQVIDAEVAEECVEAEAAEVTPEQPQDMYAEPALQDRPQLDARDTVGTWSCGQCTYMNPMTSSFCEMCIGHISLSPDVKTTAGTSVSASLLIPAKPVVDVEMTSPRVEPSTDMRSPQPSVTCMLPSVASLYSPSAPDYEMCEDERVDSTPLPPPPPYPGTSSCGNVDFLALAFSGSSAPKTQALESPPAAKASQMRCEEATTITEYTF